jgi:hypothetical protein
MADPVAAMIPGWVTDLLGQGMGVFFIVGAAAVALYIIYDVLNKQYPIINFVVLDRGIVRHVRQRLNGVEVVADDLMSLVMGRTSGPGENIRSFILMKEEVGGGKMRDVYFATMVSKVLVPIKYNPNTFLVSPTEVRNGIELGRGYISAHDESMALAKPKEPLSQVLMMTAPIAIVVMAFAVAMYLANMSLTDQMRQISATSQVTMQLVANTTANVAQLIKITRGMP